MAVQLGRGARMIVGALAPQAVIFIGEFTAALSRVHHEIEAAVQAQSIASKPPLLLAAKEGATARVRGTIALVFQKHFETPVLIAKQG